MPFGLTNAPSAFMKMMNGIFRNFLDEFVIIFIVDILVYSISKEDHERNIRAVLERLREQTLFAKLSKCSSGRGVLVSLDTLCLIRACP